MIRKMKYYTRSGMEYSIEEVKVVGEGLDTSVYVARLYPDDVLAHDGKHPWIFKTIEDARHTIVVKWR